MIAMVVGQFDKHAQDAMQAAARCIFAREAAQALRFPATMGSNHYCCGAT
jgi:hypothetical protein